LMDGRNEFQISIPDGHASYSVEGSGLTNRVNFVVKDRVVQSITTLPDSWKEIGQCADLLKATPSVDTEQRYGIIISKKDDKYVIKKVFRGPAHAAGVEVGMQLIALDETFVEKLNANELRALLNSSESAIFTFLSPKTKKELQLQIQKQ